MYVQYKLLYYLISLFLYLTCSSPYLYNIMVTATEQSLYVIKYTVEKGGTSTVTPQEPMPDALCCPRSFEV